MNVLVSPRGFLLFTGTGPMLVLSSFASGLDARMISRLGAKGIEKFLAYEVPVETVRDRYGDNFEVVARELDPAGDARILDFNGHQIMARFSLAELGEATRVE